jgi:hypothetical protein
LSKTKKYLLAGGLLLLSVWVLVFLHGYYRAVSTLNTLLGFVVGAFCAVED